MFVGASQDQPASVEKSDQIHLLYQNLNGTFSLMYFITNKLVLS